MTRRPITFIFVTLLLTFALLASGCSRSATPKVQDALPDDEANAMVDDATENTEDMQTPGAEEPGDGEPEPATESTEPTTTPEPDDEPTSEPTQEATPEPTEEATPEPTEEPTPEPTEEPTPEPTEETVSIPGKHIVQAGENLFRIALTYGLTTEAVAQANNITNPALIYPGQELTIPSGDSDSSSDDAAAPVAPSGEVVHTVQAGENLFRIALKYNYDQYYIARYNNISNLALIYPGQQIRIPNK